jgi:hypothetical protein
VPDVFVERLVDAVAGWAVEPAAPDLDAAVRDLPGPVVEAIRAGAVRPEPGRGWQWEPGRALRWTDAALRVIRAHLAGLTPTPVRAARGRVAIHVPDPALVERARAGRVLWLAVGAPPAAVAEALGADVVRVEARPEWLRTIAVTCRNWGSGRPGSATRARRAAEVQALARALAERCAAGGLVWRGERFATFGAVAHKSDRLALGDPGWCESFGRGHAAHDRLADADVLLVRRYAEPPTVLRSRARILGRAFGLEPADLLPEVEAFAGAHSMLNAIGRCRPFTAGAPRLAIVLDRQHPGLELPVDAVLGLAGLCAELDLSPDDQAIRNEMNETNERRAREAAELRERIRAAAAADPAASHRELAAGLGVGASTVRDHLAGWDRSRATPLNIYMGGCTGSDSLPTAPEIVDRIGDRWGLDRPTARRAAARALGRIRAAREAAGEDGEPVEHLGRLTGVAGRRLLDVLEACAAIAAERAAPAAAEVPDHLPAEWTAPRGIEAQVAELVAEIAPGDPVVELAAWLSLCGRAPPWIRQRAESLEAAAAG